MLATAEKTIPAQARKRQSQFSVGVQRSAIGWIAVQWQRSDQGDWNLCGISIGHPSGQAALSSLPDGRSLDLDDELDAEQIDLLNRVVDCANGKADTFADVSISLDHLGPFARKVVQRCRRIPAGQTMTYAQLAAASGSAKAARAVGNVMASNRFPLIVPCHRVVGSGGGLGGFSAPQGIELKKQLLRSEGVQI